MRHLFLYSPQVNANLWFSGIPNFSFAIADCVSQGSLVENSMGSGWFRQRWIYCRVLNGFPRLLGRWRNRPEVVSSALPSRASQPSRPPREHWPPVWSQHCLPAGSIAGPLGRWPGRAGSCFRETRRFQCAYWQKQQMCGPWLSLGSLSLSHLTQFHLIYGTLAI